MNTNFKLMKRLNVSGEYFSGGKANFYPFLSTRPN